MPRKGWAFGLLAMLSTLSGCGSEAPVAEKKLLFPSLAAQQEQLQTLTLRGAGNVALVTLERRQGRWLLAERGGWPADAGRISQYLFLLSQAHADEAKTDDPALYPRLGVEPVDAGNAQGSELTLVGPGGASILLIGKEHPKFDRNYVRVDRDPQAWLTDLPVGFDRDPLAWLDRRLVDLPLARVARVAVSGDENFSISHRDDRFRLDDAPSAAMRGSYQGDALAGALEQLRFDDLAADDGAAAAERRIRFTTVEGTSLELQLWRVGQQWWMRASTGVDTAQATAWLAGNPGDNAAAARDKQVAVWSRAFAGRRFLLPAAASGKLMLSKSEILAGQPSP